MDNWAEDEVLSEQEYTAAVGRESSRIREAESRYNLWSSPGSDNKAKGRFIDGTVLGIRAHGRLGRRDTHFRSTLQS